MTMVTTANSGIPLGAKRAKDAIPPRSGVAPPAARTMSVAEIEAELAGKVRGPLPEVRARALRVALEEKRSRGEDCAEDVDDADIPEKQWRVGIRTENDRRTFTCRARGPNEAERKAKEFYERKGVKITNVIAEGTTGDAASGAEDAGKSVYKRHIIIETMGGEFIVEKDGHRITTQSSMAAAKKAIDDLGTDCEIGATDSALVLAFDRESVREFDVDGRLRVAKANISKANVCPYRGKEIPDYDKLGLDPEKTYNLYRDPGELQKAADSSNGVQVLKKHIPVNAEDHQPWDVVGSTGTDAKFETPYLTNSLSIWAKEAIDDIESGEKKELSCGYHYRADMTAGKIDGKDYDGIMRDIVFNHVALVEQGRAGPDVVVGDSTEGLMSTRPTKFACILATRAARAVSPLLAFDQDVSMLPIFEGVTTKNFKTRKPKLLADIKAAVKGKTIAKDASMEHIAHMLDKLEMPHEDAGTLDESVSEPQHNAMEAAAHGKSTLGIPQDVGAEFAEADKGKSFDAEPLKGFLKEKGMSEDDINSVMDMMPKTGMDEDDDEKAEDEDMDDEDKAEDEKEDDEKDEKDEKAKDSKGKDSKAKDSKGKDAKPMTKEAMDQAIKLATDAAIKTTTKQVRESVLQTQREIRQAEAAVRPWVGDLSPSLAFDSAADVYRAALKIVGVAGAKDMHADALRPVLEAQPKPGARPSEQRQNNGSLGMDSGQVEDFNKRFPDAARIGVA